MTPTTAAVMPVRAADRAWLPRSRSTYGAPRKMKTKQGTNVTQVVSSAASTAATHGLSEPGVAVGAEERDELHDHDQRARRGLGEGEAADHLAGCEPAVDLDGLLGDVGQHGVGAAEGDQRGAGEEQRLVGEDAVARR